MTTRTIGAHEGALVRGAEAVAGAHADVADATGRIGAILGGLREEGEAAKAYNLLLDTWIRDGDKLNAILVDLEAALRQAEADRVAREDQNTSVINGLGSTLGSVDALMGGQ